MRLLIISLILFLIMGTLIGIHSYIMTKVSRDIDHISTSVKELAYIGNWQEVQKKLKEIKTIWDDARTWASLTISTKEIDQIDISLHQSIEFAKLGAKPDFLGEFTMFNRLVNYIPHQEGFHIEEIL